MRSPPPPFLCGVLCEVSKVYGAVRMPSAAYNEKQSAPKWWKNGRCNSRNCFFGVNFFFGAFFYLFGIVFSYYFYFIFPQACRFACEGDSAFGNNVQITSSVTYSIFYRRRLTAKCNPREKDAIRGGLKKERVKWLI